MHLNLRLSDGRPKGQGHICGFGLVLGWVSFLVSGLRYRDIVKRLPVAADTVKRHINNICGKLAVANRIQARVKARRLRPIDD